MARERPQARGLRAGERAGSGQGNGQCCGQALGNAAGRAAGRLWAGQRAGERAGSGQCSGQCSGHVWLALPGAGDAHIQRLRAGPASRPCRGQQQRRPAFPAVSAGKGAQSAAEHGAAGGGGPIREREWLRSAELQPGQAMEPPARPPRPGDPAGLRLRLPAPPTGPAHCGEALAAAHAHCGRTASPVPPGPAPGESRSGSGAARAGRSGGRVERLFIAREAPLARGVLSRGFAPCVPPRADSPGSVRSRCGGQLVSEGRAGAAAAPRDSPERCHFPSRHSQWRRPCGPRGPGVRSAPFSVRAGGAEGPGLPRCGAAGRGAPLSAGAGGAGRSRRPPEIPGPGSPRPGRAASAQKTPPHRGCRACGAADRQPPRREGRG